MGSGHILIMLGACVRVLTLINGSHSNANFTQTSMMLCFGESELILMFFLFFFLFLFLLNNLCVVTSIIHLNIWTLCKIWGIFAYMWSKL